MERVSAPNFEANFVNHCAELQSFADWRRNQQAATMVAQLLTRSLLKQVNKYFDALDVAPSGRQFGPLQVEEIQKTLGWTRSWATVEEIATQLHTDKDPARVMPTEHQ